MSSANDTVVSEELTVPVFTAFDEGAASRNVKTCATVFRPNDYCSQCSAFVELKPLTLILLMWRIG